MANTYDEYLDLKRFRALDGIRGICIIGVVWHHSQLPDTLPALFSKGFLGVDMFFVLSGYLIVTLLLREKKRSGEISLANFYMRRILKIFPVYYLTLFALGGMYLILKPGDNDTRIFLELSPYYVFFASNWLTVQIPNLGIAWSLATEEQFYIVWPLIEKLVQGKILYIIIAIFFIVNQCINFGLLDGWLANLYGLEQAPALAILDTTFTPVCLGVALAHLLHNKDSFKWASYLCARAYSPILFSGLLIFYLQWAGSDISGAPRLIIQILMTLFLCSVVLLDRSMIARFLCLKPLKSCGEISYGMYLFHMIALHFSRLIVDRLGIAIFGYEYFLLGLAITFTIAWFSFNYFESWFLGLKKTFKSRPELTAANA